VLIQFVLLHLLPAHPVDQDESILAWERQGGQRVVKKVWHAQLLSHLPLHFPPSSGRRTFPRMEEERHRNSNCSESHPTI
jgi:hypothetical protein